MSNSASVIQGYYQTILSRTGTVDEVAGWVNLVDSSGVPLSLVQAGFANSFEALTNVAPIIEMYQVHLGRVPDQAGLASWVHALESGTLTLAQIGALIASSPESVAYYGSTFDSGFITVLYERVLGREPEPGAVNAWLAAKAGGMTQAQMQEAFRTSIEAQTRAVPAVTKHLLDMANGTSSAYAGSLYTGGQVFVLTSGQNSGLSFTGTVVDDTYQATEDTTSGSAIPTWTTADAIDGGTGTDTFNVIQTAAIAGAPLGATVTNVEIVNILDASSVTLNTTGWTGLTALNVTDVGTTVLTAAGTTAVTVTDTAGNVTVSGGSNQSVSTNAGTVALTGALGSIVVNDTAIGSNSVTVDNGSSVNVVVSGETGGGTINIGGNTAPTGAVTVTASSSPTATSSTAMGTIDVTGGTTVNVTQNALGGVNRDTTLGAVTIHGTATTTAVSVTATPRAAHTANATGVVENTVTILDVNGDSSSSVAGTIVSAAVSGYTTLSIQDNALTTLSVANGSGNIIIDNSSALVSPTNTALNLTVSGLTGGTLDDADIYRTLNITTAGANSTLANITLGADTALNVAGTKQLTLTSTAGLTSLSTVTVSGAAGLTADLSSPLVTAVDTSGTTGSSAFTIDGTRTTFTGGAGVDKIIVINGVTKAISLGDGDDSLVIGSFVPTAAISGGPGTDTLTMDSTTAATASGSASFANLVTGFEKLILTGATNQTVDLSVLGVPNAVTTHGGNGLTLTNLNNGGTLTLDGAGTAYTVANTAFLSGASDTINLVLTNAAGVGTNFASSGVTAANVENIAITNTDTQSTPTGTFNNFISFPGNFAKTITVSGNAGLTLTATDSAATLIDASGITLGGFTYTSGALSSAAIIKGSASGTNVVDFSAASRGVTYTGGSGSDIVTVTNSQSNVINLGNGSNSVSATGNGAQSITGGTGNDTITVGNGNNTISTGDGADTVTTGNGVNIITVNGGSDTITVGSGSNTINLGTHGSNLVDSISVAANANGSFVPTASITGLNTVGLDTITFLGDNLANRFTVFTPAQVNAFGDSLGTSNPPTTLAMAVTDVLGTGVLGGNLAQHAIGAFQFGGATYLVEQKNAAGTAFAIGDTLIKIEGTPTFNTTSVSGGVLRLLT